MKLILKNKALNLRRHGKTYAEIQKSIGPIPKGTLSAWLKPITLTEPQRQRILRKISDGGAIGRQKGGWTNHQKRLTRINDIQESARQQFKTLLQEQIFLPGLALYLAEGAKKHEYFQFMNSDLHLVRLMIQWIIKIGNIEKENIKLRLYAHHVYAHERCEEYWSANTHIPLTQFYKTVYKPTSHLLKKNSSYKGCLRVEVSGSELFWKVKAWGDMMYELFQA